MHINNTLTVGELRELLSQFPEEMPVMMAVNDSPVHVRTINHTVEMAWRIKDGTYVDVIPPDSKDRVGIMVTLR